MTYEHLSYVGAALLAICCGIAVWRDHRNHRPDRIRMTEQRQQLCDRETNRQNGGPIQYRSWR